MHYVPRVIAFFNGDWQLDYFINPTLYMYVLYAATVLLGYFSEFEEFSLHVTFNPHLVLWVGMPGEQILSIDRFPERAPHLTGGLPQWDELLE